MRMVYIAPVCICLNLLYIIIIISIYYYIISVVIKDPSRDAYFPLQKMMIHHEREASPLWNARSRNAETLLGGWGTYAGGANVFAENCLNRFGLLKQQERLSYLPKSKIHTHYRPLPPHKPLISRNERWPGRGKQSIAKQMYVWRSTNPLRTILFQLNKTNMYIVHHFGDEQKKT